MGDTQSKLKIIIGNTLRSVINQANELKISKDCIVAIVPMNNEVCLIYQN